MILDPALRRSVAAVGAALRDARDPWWIIAGAAVALHGVDTGQVRDVDVLLSMADAGSILPAIGITPYRGSPHPDFRSDLFATWHAHPLPIEFMSGFRHRSNGIRHPVRPASRQAVVIDGVTVSVPDRAELRRLLKAFGREKDLARATALIRE